MPEEQRFVLGIAYQAGPDPRIKRGADGSRDWFSKEELELACWSFMRSGCPQMNAFHVDGTEDCAEPVESFIWRWDEWDVGDGIVVKDGDWCLGAILSPDMWGLYKAGQINGLSPEGTATRRRVRKEGAVALTKSMADIEDEDEGFDSELVDATVPKVALVGKGANGIPRFLIAKGQEDSASLFDPTFVRQLIKKAEADEPAATHPQEMVTVTASPAAMAALIHGASVRKAGPDTDEDVAKAAASTATMNDRPDSDFAYIEAGGKKDESGKTVPRSLRHFPVYDAAHVRNALSRAPQSPFGDKAMPAIRSAAKKFGVDVAKAVDVDEMPGEDVLDPTTVLACPDEEAPGDPNDPGSPAWEAIDAATARKWASIASRLRSALGVMADREMLEAAEADPSDEENAWDLDDAADAVDFAISVLAPFAYDEQAEADCGSAEMEALGKALESVRPSDIDAVEALGQMRKAGRALSGANESALRQAITALQQILASLPKAASTADTDGGPAVAKTANEEPDMPEPTLTEDVTTASGQAPALGTASPDPKPVAGEPVTDVTKSAGPSVDEIVAKLAAALAPTPLETVVGEVAKADKTPQVAIYDANGNLVGTVDPAEITMLAPAKAPDAGDGEEMGKDDAQPQEQAPVAAPPAPPTDLTPAPAAEAGTPADAVPDGVAKQAATEAADDTDTQNVLKGSDITSLVKAVLEDYSAGQANVVKELKDQNAELKEYTETLTKRLEAVENAPAVMAIASHGAVPPKHMLRGQDYGAVADMTEGQVLRKRLATSDDAQEQQRLATDLNVMAIDKLKAMHAQRRPENA